MDLTILDCTLRDGGYYTNWDFNREFVKNYLTVCNRLPISYIEVGYRHLPSDKYIGEYGYCTEGTLRFIQQNTSKKIAIMVDEKSLLPEKAKELLLPVKKYVSLVRISVDPQNIERSLCLVEIIKKLGFEVACNVMYMSKWNSYPHLFESLAKLSQSADILYMVDSYGSVLPTEIGEITNKIKNSCSCTIGFHGHNNLELALANTIESISAGVSMIDSTFSGMGRGAGNLKTELLLTYLNKKNGLAVDFNVLGTMMSLMTSLVDEYQWGTNLPYMLSGANSYPQKEVMAMLQNRLYSLNQIVNVLEKHTSTNAIELPQLAKQQVDCVIIIGGGQSVVEHSEGLREFISKHTNVALVHATAKNAAPYKDMRVPQYFCVVGNEENRIQKIAEKGELNGMCIYASGSELLRIKLPSFAEGKSFQVAVSEFSEKYVDSCTSLALQTARLLCAGDIFIVGYDGYKNGVLSEKEATLTMENKELFSLFQTHYGVQLISLTPTLYNELKQKSLYQFL